MVATETETCTASKRVVHTVLECFLVHETQTSSFSMRKGITLWGLNGMGGDSDICSLNKCELRGGSGDVCRTHLFVWQKCILCYLEEIFLDRLAFKKTSLDMQL